MGLQQQQIGLQQQKMKKTHTKNLLSMAPTLTMFASKPSQNSHIIFNREQKSLSTNLASESLAASTSNRNPAIKYNRSISSFRKYKESPDKKFSALYGHGSATKSRPTLPKNMMEAHPFQKMMQILRYQIPARSQQGLFQDFNNKMEGCVKILEDSLQSSTLINVFKQLKCYFAKIFSLTLKLAEKQLGLYTEQFTTICNQYEQKLKEGETQYRSKFKQQILSADSQLGRKIAEMKNRADFTTQVFNQMESCNIDLMKWVRESECMYNFISNIEGQPEHESQSQIINSEVFQQTQKQIVNDRKNRKLDQNFQKQEQSQNCNIVEQAIGSSRPQMERIDEEVEFETLTLQKQRPHTLHRQQRTLNSRKGTKQEKLNKSR